MKELAIVVSATGEAMEAADERNPAKRICTLDEAIEATAVGKYQATLICLAGLSHMGGLLECSNMSVVAPYARCELGFSTAEQGVLLSATLFGMVCALYFWGFVADSYGRQKALRASTIGGILMSLIATFSYDIYSLIVFRFLTGAFFAGTQSVPLTYIAEFHPEAKAARAAAFVTIFAPPVWIIISSLSIVLIPMDWVLWFASFPFRPWRLLLLILTVSNLWNAIVFSCLPETPKFLVANNREDEALEVLRRVYAFNTGEPEEAYPVKGVVYEATSNGTTTKSAWNAIRSIWTQTKPIFQEPLAHNTWKLCYIGFCMLIAGYGAYMWLPGFLIQLQNHHDEPSALCEMIGNQPVHAPNDECGNIDNKNITSQQIMVGIAVFLTFLAVLASFFMKKINLKYIIVFWVTLSSAASASISFFTELAAIIISYLALISTAQCFSIIVAYSTTLYPTECRATATAFITLCARLGGVLGINLIGILLNIQCTSIFYMIAATLISCAVTFMFVKERTK